MATTSTIKTVRRIQYTMAASYSAMSAWCVLHPSSVISLSLNSPHAIVNRTTMLLTRCFGAQAMTVGLLLFTSDMTARSFTAFGLAMLPYLGFNAWFLGGPGKGVFTGWLWLDAVGNTFFLGGSLVAAGLLRGEEKENKKKKL